MSSLLIAYLLLIHTSGFIRRYPIEATQIRFEIDTFLTISDLLLETAPAAIPVRLFEHVHPCHHRVTLGATMFACLFLVTALAQPEKATAL